MVRGMHTRYAGVLQPWATLRQDHIWSIVKSYGSIDVVAYEEIRDVELASNTMMRQGAGNM